jgi:hypothetical protein
MHLRRRWINRQVYEYFAVNVGPMIGWRDPILVYQMGGVGSSSIRNSLFRYRDPRTKLVLMCHEFFPIRSRDPARMDLEPECRNHVLREMEHDRRVFEGFPLRRKIGWLFRKRFYTERIYDAYVRRGDELRVITLVRDPVAHNVSLFFQVFDQYAGTSIEGSGLDIDGMIRLFLDRYVYRRPFPTDRGYAVLSEGRVRLIVLRSELDDAAKARAIARFLGLDDFEIVRSNVTADKPHAVRYSEFKRRLRIPPALLEELYESRFARHFYSPDERARFRTRWGGGERGP